MSDSLGDMVVSFTADIAGLTTSTKEAKKEISSVGTTTTKVSEETSRGFGSMVKAGMGFAAGMGIFDVAAKGLGFLKDQFVGMLKESTDAQLGMADTVATLKSTHDASGMTAQSIGDLATKYSHLTRFSDDTVQSTENMLLTFTNIGKNVFPQATQATLDLAQKMGGDTKSAAIMLGKALDDPVNGLNSLHRVGVKISPALKETVTQMMAVGNVSGAQKAILKELNSEFGGVAEAAGKTLPGQLDILKQNFNDMKQNIGDLVIPKLTDFVGVINTKVMPVVGKIGDAFGKAFEDVKGTLGQIGSIIGQTFKDLTGGKNPLASMFGGKGPDLKGIGDTFHNLMMGIQKDLSVVNPQQLATAFQQIGSQISGAFKQVQQAVGPALKEIGGIIGGQLVQNFQFALKWGKQISGWFTSEMLPAIKQALPGFMHLGDVLLNQLAPALAKAWAQGQQIYRIIAADVIPIFEKVAPIVVKVAGFLADNLGKAITFLLPSFNQAVVAVGGFAKEISDKVMPIVNNFFTALDRAMPVLMAIWNAAWPIMKNVLRGVWDVIVGVVKIAWAVVSGIIKIGLDVLSGNWKGVWNDIKGMLSGVWDGMKSLISGAMRLILQIIFGAGANIQNALIGPFQAAWGYIGGILGNIESGVSNALGSIGGFFGIGGHASGIFDSPTTHVAVVGEKGPELMIIPKGASVYPHGQYPSSNAAASSAAMVSNSGGGGPKTQTIQVFLDSMMIGQASGNAQSTLIQVKTGVRQWG